MEVFCPFLMSYPFSPAVNTFSLTNCTVWHEYYGYNKQNNLYASNLFRCAILESAVQGYIILSSRTNISCDEKQEYLIRIQLYILALQNNLWFINNIALTFHQMSVLSKNLLLYIRKFYEIKYLILIHVWMQREAEMDSREC